MATTTSPIERYDPLAQFMAPAKPAEPADIHRAARLLAGCTLLAASLAAGAWLVTLIHAVVFHPRTVGLLDRLAPAKIEDLTLTLPAGKVELPAAVTTVIGYLIVLALVSVVAKLATAMLKQGVTLVRREATTSEAGHGSQPEGSTPDSPP